MTDVPAHILRGQETRRRIMRRAVDVATREGLEALTIGRVAKAMGLSKATILGHYASKETLQLATLAAGRERFIEDVVAPTVDLPPGIVRLERLLDGWIDQISEVAGGCFFASVAAEFDARPGPIRDETRKILRHWVKGLSAVIEEAKEHRHLRADVDSSQVAFELHGVELALNLRLQLFDEKAAISRARRAMHERIRSCATATGRRHMAGGPRPSKPKRRSP